MNIQTVSDVASIDTYTMIGITIVIAFVVFALGVLVTTSIGCLVKNRSKVSLHQPAREPSVYGMIETDKKIITAIEVKANSA